MKSITPHKPGGHVVAHKTDGNPEGKGVNGFLLDWHKTEPRGVVAKPQPQVLAEVFTSMLVLSASFKFRPAVGVATYLYWVDDEWSLSLIAPAERLWGLSPFDKRGDRHRVDDQEGPILFFRSR